MAIRKKSILDDILNGIGQTGSNIASSVSQLATPTIQAASTFADNFVKGLQNNTQQSQQIEQQGRQQISDFTHNFLNTAQNVGSSALDYFNPIKAKPNTSFLSTILPSQNIFDQTTGNAQNLYKFATGPVPKQVLKIGKDAALAAGDMYSPMSTAGQVQMINDPKAYLQNEQNNLKLVQQQNPSLVSLNKTTNQLEPNMLEHTKAILKGAGLLMNPASVAAMGVMNIPMVGVQNLIDKKAPWAQDYQKSIAQGVDFGALLGPVSEFAGGVLKPFLSFIKPAELPTLSDLILTHNSATDAAMKAATQNQIANVVRRNLLEASTKGFAGMGAVGAMEPADTIQQRIYNTITYGLQGAAFEAGGKALGLGFETLKKPGLNIIPQDISTQTPGLPTPPPGEISPSNQANLNPDDPQFRMAPPTSSDVIRTGPILNAKQDISVTDIHGNKSVIPQGEALTPYELKDNRVLLKDGGEYIVSKNQYENIKGQSIKAEAQPFAPELAQTTETIRAATPQSKIDEVRNYRTMLDNKYGDFSKAPQSEYDNYIKMSNEVTMNPGTKYQNYQLPDGENYREILIQSPEAVATKLPEGTIIKPSGNNMGYYDVSFPAEGPDSVIPDGMGYTFPATSMETATAETLREYRQMSIDFLSSHWSEPNVISHIRLNDRVAPDGGKVTFIEEIQSDWARTGRENGFKQNLTSLPVDTAKVELTTDPNGKKMWEGYQLMPEGDHLTWMGRAYSYISEAEAKQNLLNILNKETSRNVPNHPLLKNWQELSIKRALIDAVNNGSEYLSWTNGEQQAARYNLSTQVKDMSWGPGDTVGYPGTKRVTIHPLNDKADIILFADVGTGIIQHSAHTNLNGKTLEEVVGKGIGEKMMKENTGDLSGEGLNIGGEWANNLYNKQIKNIVEDLTGGKVETLDMGLPIDAKNNIDTIWRFSDSGLLPKNQGLQVGDKLFRNMDGDSSWIVTDILGDGKFKAVSRENWNRFNPGVDSSRMAKQKVEEAKQTFDISSPKSAGQQAIKITPEIRAKILGQSPQVKQPSGVSPFDNKSDIPQYSVGDTNQLSDSASLIQKDLQQMLNEDISKQPETTPPESFDKTVKEAEDIIASFFTPEEITFKTQGEPIVTPEGIMAQGVYYKALIKVLEQGGKVESKTVYHEAFHAYADKFVNPDLYGAALYDVMSKDGITKQAASEKLAESFADYVSGKQTFTGQVLAFFQDFINKFRGMIGKDNSAQMIYDSILNKERPTTQPGEIGTPAVNPQFRTTKDEQGNFVPSEKWQEYNPNQAVPIGGEFKTENGKQYVRFPKEITQQNADIIKRDQGAQVATPQDNITSMPLDANSNSSMPLDATNIVPPVPPEAAVTNPQDPFYNVNRMGVSNEAKQLVKDTIQSPDVSSQIDSITGQPLTHEEIRIRANEAQPLTDLKTRAVAKELGASAVALRDRVAELSTLGMNDQQFQDALIKDKAFGTFLARLLGQRRIMSDPQGKTLLDDIISRIIKEGHNPEDVIAASKGVDWYNQDEVTKFYRTFIKATPGDWIDKVRYNSMLSGLNTHIINMASNWQGSLFVTPAVKFTNGIVDGIMSKITGKEQTQFAGEGLAYSKSAATEGIQRGWSNLVKILGGDATGSGTSVKFADANPHMRFIDLTTSGDTLHPLETILDVPGKALEAEDQFFIAITKAGLESSYKYREGKGIKVADKTNLINAEAEKILFRAPLNRKGEGVLVSGLLEGAQLIQRATYAKNPIVRWLAKMSFPFVRVSSNIAVEGIQGNPVLGAINMIGKENKVEAISKMMLGSVATIAGMGLVTSGRMHAAEPTDPAKKAAFRAAGYQPWSVDLPGGQNIQFNKMHPILAMQLGLVAAIGQSLQDNKLSEDNAAKVMDAFTGSLRYFTDQTYVATLQDFGKAISGDPTAFSSLVSHYPSQFIPYKSFGGWITRIIDDTQRKPDSKAGFLVETFQNITQGIPGASFAVPARVDQYGTPLKNNNRLFNALSPYKTSPLNQVGINDYQDLLQRADQNKLLKMQQDAQTQGNAALDTRTPTEKAAAGRLGIKSDIAKNNLKLGNGQSELVGKNYPYFDTNTNSVKTIDLGKFSKEATGIDKYKQQEAKYSTARQIYESALTDQQKQDAYKTLGVKDTEVQYDYYAGQTNELKTNYLIDYFKDKTHDEILSTLANGRVSSISGNQLSSTGVIDAMETEGLITTDEAKALKAIKYNSKGELLKTGGSSSKAFLSLTSGVNNVTVPTTKVASYQPSVSGSTTGGSGGIGNITYKRIKTQRPAALSTNGGQSGFTPTLISPKLKSMPTNLASLGQL